MKEKKREYQFKLRLLFEIKNKRGLIGFIIFVFGFVLAFISLYHGFPRVINICGFAFGMCISFIGSLTYFFILQKRNDLLLKLKGDKLEVFNRSKKIVSIDLSNPHFFLVVLRYWLDSGKYIVAGIKRSLLVLLSQGNNKFYFESDYDYISIIGDKEPDFRINPLFEKLQSFIDGKDFKGKPMLKKYPIPRGAFFITPAEYQLDLLNVDDEKKIREEFIEFLFQVDKYHYNNLGRKILDAYELNTITFNDILKMMLKF